MFESGCFFELFLLMQSRGFALVVGGAFGFVFCVQESMRNFVSGFVKAFLGVMKFLFVCCALCFEACFVAFVFCFRLFFALRVEIVLSFVIELCLRFGFCCWFVFCFDCDAAVC